MTNEAQIRKYEIEIKRLDDEFAHLESLWAKYPRYGYLALLAPVVWYFKGLGWAIVELLVTAALTGTQAYLIGVRKSENRWNQASLVEDLRNLRNETAPTTDAAQPELGSARTAS